MIALERSDQRLAGSHQPKQRKTCNEGWPRREARRRWAEIGSDDEPRFTLGVAGLFHAEQANSSAQLGPNPAVRLAAVTVATLTDRTRTITRRDRRHCGLF